MEARRVTLDWRQLERFRRMMRPDLRGVNWTCNHFEHDPTEGRGPLRRTQNHAHAFVVSSSRSRYGRNGLIEPAA